MTTFGELLEKSKDAIVKRWLKMALQSYSKEAVVAFAREKDPFANPVGHALRIGTEGAFESLRTGMESEEAANHLEEVIKIRAVQEFSPSQAVDVVFELKDAIRAELGNAVADAKIATELTEFERRIDRVALVGFDIFVRCREQLYELRVNEAKRRVSWVIKKMNERGEGPESDPDESTTSNGTNVRREGPQ